MINHTKSSAAGVPTAEKVLKFIQINMNKAALAAISLNERLKSIRGDFVCLITEPYNFKGKAASLPSNAQVVPGNTEEKASRAIIIASPNCEIVEVSNLCSRDSAVAHCKIDKVNILLCSIYMDVTLPVQQEFLNLSLIHI